MLLLEMLGEALALVTGSFLAAALAVCLSWNVFKLIKRPEWGPCAAFLIMLAAYLEESSKSPLLTMAMIFTMVSSCAAWPVGSEWRGRKKLHRLFGIESRPIRRRFWGR